tara:strand:- start:546 stop:839 length:294 start_codon:yes stop_codon:yes gene_type:complete
MVPRISTVIIKKDSSGKIGAKTGSAIPPKVPLIPGFIISRVIKIMIINIIIIEPPGGWGGGGLLLLVINRGESMKGMKVGIDFNKNIQTLLSVIFKP